MKSFRWTLVFAIVIGALVALTFWDQKRADKKTELTERSATFVPYSESEISNLEIQVAKAPAKVFEKRNGTWRILQPIEDGVDAQEFATLLNQLRGEKALETVIEGEDIAWSTYGLSQPDLKLVLRTTSGEERTVSIGSVKAFDGSAYARIDKDPRVLLASSAWDVHLTKTVNELRDKSLYRGPVGQKFARVTIESGLEKIELIRKDGMWSMTKPDPKNAPLSQEAIQRFVEDVTAARAMDFTQTQAAGGAAELKKLGFGPASYSITMIPESENPKSFKVAMSEPESLGANVNAISSDLPVVVQLYGVQSEALRRSSYDFFDKTAPFKIDLTKASKVEIRSNDLQFLKNSEKRAEFVKSGNSWILTPQPNSTSGQMSADSTKLQELLNALPKLEAMRFLAQAPKQRPDSFLNVRDETGKVLFEMSWGAPVSEGPKIPGAEVQVVPVKASTSDRWLGLTEGSVKALPIRSLIKENGK